MQRAETSGVTGMLQNLGRKAWDAADSAEEVSSFGQKVKERARQKASSKKKAAEATAPRITRASVRPSTASTPKAARAQPKDLKGPASADADPLDNLDLVPPLSQADPKALLQPEGNTRRRASGMHVLPGCSPGRSDLAIRSPSFRPRHLPPYSPEKAAPASRLAPNQTRPKERSEGVQEQDKNGEDPEAVAMERDAGDSQKPAPKKCEVVSGQRNWNPGPCPDLSRVFLQPGRRHSVNRQLQLTALRHQQKRRPLPR